MKRMKKVVSLLLAMIMIFVMSATAFAAELGDEPDLDPNGDSETSAAADTNNHPTISSGQYEIYQIFTGEYSDGILSNVRWGQNGTGYNSTLTEQALVPEDVMEELEELSHEHDDTCGSEGNWTCGKKEYTDVERLKVIEKYAVLENPVKSGTDTTYTGLEQGYYLVKGTVTFSDKQTADTLYVVSVIDGTLAFVPKVDVPTSTKKIVEDNNRVDVNEAAIGDTVSYEITGTLPSNYDVYKEYYYVFTDTLSKGLTLQAEYVDGAESGVITDGIRVTVDGTDVTQYFYKEATAYDATNGTTITVGIQNLKWLDELAKITVTADSEIVVTYDAVLNVNAVIAGEGNPNDVVLDYYNNPNKSGDGTTPPPDEPEKPSPKYPKGQTPKDEVKTYTTELAILKTDEDGEILEGAEFTLTGDGVKVSLVTKEEFKEAQDGAYWKLKNGSYTTIAPVTAEDETNNEEAYDLDAGKFTLVRTIEMSTEDNGTKAIATIDKDGRVTFTGLGKGKYTITESKTPAGYNTAKDITFTIDFDPAKQAFSADNVSLGVNNTLEVTVVNQRGSLLPSTGGIGTTIFYVVGAVLVIGAGVLLVAKKRMSKN